MTIKDRLLALYVVVVWGINFVVMKIGLHDMPALSAGRAAFFAGGVARRAVGHVGVAGQCVWRAVMAVAPGASALILVVNVGEPALSRCEAQTLAGAETGESRGR